MIGSGGNISKHIGVQTFVDEVCDDGNRLDGDGCSADCLSRDKIDSACEIVVDWASSTTYEAITFLSPMFRDRNDPFVAVTNGIYRLSLTIANPNALTPFFLAPKSFPVSNMIIVGTEIYMYSAGVKMVFSLSVYGAVPIQTVCSINIGVTNEPGFFYVTSNTLYLVVKDSMNIVLLKIEGGGCTPDVASLVSQNPFQPVTLYTQDINKPACVTAVLQAENIAHQASAVELCPGIPSQHIFSTSISRDISTKPWIQSFQYAFGPVQKVRFQGAYSKILFINSSFHEVQDYSSDMSAFMNNVFIYSPFYIVQMLPMIRERLIHTSGSENNFIFLGNPIIYTASQSEDYVCGIEACAMDFYTTYNIISQNPNTLITSSDVTFDTVLGTLFSTSDATSLSDYANVNVTLAKFPLELAKHGYPPNPTIQIVTHPTTGSEWIIDGSKLVEVSKRGASYEMSPGRCVPATLGLCPPCHMYQLVGPCIPCATVTLTETVEWRLQCQSCPPTGSRRMLLATQLLTVAFVISGSNATELAVLFPQAQVTNAIAGALEVKIQTSDPVATISFISITANARPFWKMDVQPRTVYTLTAAASMPSTTTKADGNKNSNSSDIIPVWVWGLVGGLVLLVIIIITLCYVYRPKIHTYAQVAMTSAANQP